MPIIDALLTQFDGIINSHPTLFLSLKWSWMVFLLLYPYYKLLKENVPLIGWKETLKSHILPLICLTVIGAIIFAGILYGIGWWLFER